MTDVWVVRAEFGKYTPIFVEGGYVGAGWVPGKNLSAVKDIDELRSIFRQAHPDQTANQAGANTGMLARFLFEIKAGDYVITPAFETEWLHYGKVAEDPSYDYVPGGDECPFPHRRKTEWAKEPLRRWDLSVSFQNTMKATKTVFHVSHKDEFLRKINQAPLVSEPKLPKGDPRDVVLKQILQFNAKEFEGLVGALLVALGFDNTKLTGKPGDGGVDATGEFDLSNLVKVKVFVQAKRYQNRKVTASDVKKLRASIPDRGQGVVITTSDYRDKAREAAVEPGFPRIGLVNGHQLVDLLIKHWACISNSKEFEEEFGENLGEKLGLEPGLVRL